MKKTKKAKAPSTEQVLNAVEEQITESKQIPKDIMNNILTLIYPNIIFANLIMLLLNLLLFGHINIKPNIYSIDLNVLTAISILFTIFVFETAYKKDNNMWALYGLESLIVSFFILSLTYINQYKTSLYEVYVFLIFIAFAIYYMVKSIIIYVLEIKKHKKISNDIQKILK